VTQPPTSLYVDVGKGTWQERRPGIHWNVLWQEGDRKAVLIRYDPGSVVPRHRHLGDEQIFVIEGSVSDDTGTCTAGNYARRPPGCVHTVTSPGGALVIAVMTGATEPVAS
jgi:anti-sigma factor ChrR (cupin superfamily)